MAQDPRWSPARRWPATRGRCRPRPARRGGAGQNIDRLNSEAAFARPCGAAPAPVSSGKAHRMRLHRGGDRQADRALHMIAVCRLRYHRQTIAYMQRRRADGLSKKDVLRCLKQLHRPRSLQRPQNRPRTHLTSIGPSRHRTPSRAKACWEALAAHRPIALSGRAPHSSA
ncbi:IS110 family transposase [Allosalinactinospora lopnorensis]|uniref:IS110 family transposase n=1 Tax=Allosalinactinospora lopnorensis TaxID=1352348 RepID=UPI001F3A47F4|nr:IS110 family transposase [Allosalinactinospora lopnorensis]